MRTQPARRSRAASLGKITTPSVRRLTSRLSRSRWLVDQILRQWASGKSANAVMLARASQCCSFLLVLAWQNPAHEHAPRLVARRLRNGAQLPDLRAGQRVEPVATARRLVAVRMTSEADHHGWWWTTQEEWQSAAYLRALAAGAQAADAAHSSSVCPYRDSGILEERRLLACWSWGWSRVTLFKEPAEIVGLGPPPALPERTVGPGDIGLEDTTATPLARWGLPDHRGCFLVRVVDYEHYSFAEDLSGIGNWLLGAVHRAVGDLFPAVHHSELGGYLTLTKGEYANPLVAQVADGTLLAAVGHEGYSLNPRRNSRPPSIWELARWAGLPQPPPPPPPPPTPTELLLESLGGAGGI